MDVTDQFTKNMSAIANSDEPLFAPSGRIRRQRGVSRGDVIATFQYAFEMVGGVPRLAVWADANPTEFFKLYGRLLPSSSSNELDGPQEIVIKHVLERPNYDASQSHRAQLQTEAHIPALPQQEPALGTARSSPERRKNSRDDK